MKLGSKIEGELTPVKFRGGWAKCLSEFCEYSLSQTSDGRLIWM